MKWAYLGLMIVISTATSFAQERLDLPKVKGVVRQVDLNNARIKIKHEEIPNLNMPAMTMTFTAADATILQGAC
ncbi:MAG: copper-binding protein [Bdellovibrionales bacterium]|nr:copper-binding protein [Bdellovibrionales bacterium]